MRYCMKLEAGVLVTYSCYYIAGIANETSSTSLIFNPIILIVNNIMKSLVLNPFGCEYICVVLLDASEWYELGLRFV